MKKNINKIVSKVLKETLEEKADNLLSKIKTDINELGGMEDSHPTFGNLNFSELSPEDFRRLLSKSKGEDEEFEDNEYEEDSKLNKMYGDDYNDYEEEDFEEEFTEQFDDLETEINRMGKGYDKDEFADIDLDKVDYSSLEDDSTTPDRFMDNQIKQYKRRFGHDFDERDLNEGENVCEQCGTGLTEGECTECGYKMESELEEDIHDVQDLNDENEFDYVQEESEDNKEVCKYHMDNFGPDDERTVMYCKGIKESLRGKQRLLDKNKNNKLDREDFKLLRKGKKKETKEGKKFPDLSGDGKVTKKDILMGRGVKLGKKKIKESIQLTEDEVLDLIEAIVKEEKKMKDSGRVKGIEAYGRAHKGSGKENKEYLSSVAKKMKDYLKDGSKGEYTESPKHFPKGNGQLEKMKSKKYTMSDEGKEFIDNFMRPGMENLDYDEIHPNEKWMEQTIEGSEMTGNSDKYANAEQTEVNKSINKKRKENKLAKAKRMAYNKAPQPVIKDNTGEESGKGLNLKLESENVKQLKMLNEEFSRMNQLISYNRKTQ